MTRTLTYAALVTILAVPALSGKKDKDAEAAPAMDPASAEAVVEYRHNLFESMGKHMKLSSYIVKGKVDAKGDMLLHAQALHGASMSIPNLFPAGTGPDAFPKTEALPSIWEDSAGFAQAAKNFQDASAKLVEVAQAGDLEGFKAQFGQVGKTCGGCHDSFRKDDD